MVEGDLEPDELSPKQKRKLKSIAKAIDSLCSDLRETWPEAVIVTLDSGGLSVYNKANEPYGRGFGDLTCLGQVNCNISGGSF